MIFLVLQKKDIAGGSEDGYYVAIHCVQKKTSILYKQKPAELNVGPYNSVFLKLVKSNMNLQFVTGIYAILTYLTSYLCKPEYAMN